MAHARKSGKAQGLVFVLLIELIMAPVISAQGNPEEVLRDLNSRKSREELLQLREKEKNTPPETTTKPPHKEMESQAGALLSTLFSSPKKYYKELFTLGVSVTVVGLELRWKNLRQARGQRAFPQFGHPTYGLRGHAETELRPLFEQARSATTSPQVREAYERFTAKEKEVLENLRREYPGRLSGGCRRIHQLIASPSASELSLAVSARNHGEGSELAELSNEDAIAEAMMNQMAKAMSAYERGLSQAELVSFRRNYVGRASRALSPWLLLGLATLSYSGLGQVEQAIATARQDDEAKKAAKQRAIELDKNAITLLIEPTLRLIEDAWRAEPRLNSWYPCPIDQHSELDIRKEDQKIMLGFLMETAGELGVIKKRMMEEPSLPSGRVKIRQEAYETLITKSLALDPDFPKYLAEQKKKDPNIERKLYAEIIPEMASEIRARLFIDRDETDE